MAFFTRRGVSVPELPSEISTEKLSATTDEAVETAETDDLYNFVVDRAYGVEV